MKCPLCHGKEHVEIDLHAEGFAQDARECGDCGAVWTYSGDVLKIIRGKVEPRQRVFTDFVCPTCRCMVTHETDLTSFQFHEELFECTVCGTVSSLSHGQVEVVRDSQQGSFLDSSGEQVEADDFDTMKS